MQKIPKEIPSCDGVHTLRGILCLPEEPKAIVQIVHGMAEHIGRYDAFMTYLAENGFIACGHDHLGHGKTAENDDELGFFAEKNGDVLVCEDTFAFGKAIKEAYPSLPLILLGHSMGSFIARQTVRIHPEACEALIIMGTGGKNPISALGLATASVIGMLRGKKHVSKLILSVAFSSYNKRTGGEKYSFEWLSCDEKEVEKHDSDKFCTFLFTVSAMRDLIRLQSIVNRKDWYEKIPKDLPVFIVSGAEDPVGNYGKGVEEVYTSLIAEGVTDVTRKIYPSMRHEILNELDRKTVYEDILSFISSQIS
ncbi:MAG: alpha/beta hydrolase [Ruminococcaceae bacterium]|nr:alpha/beta hydrolase [Oscillospiraceae bacterium]